MATGGRKRSCYVGRTQPQPPEPQSETGTLATHNSEKPGSALACFGLHGLELLGQPVGLINDSGIIV